MSSVSVLLVDYIYKDFILRQTYSISLYVYTIQNLSHRHRAFNVIAKPILIIQPVLVYSTKLESQSSQCHLKIFINDTL